MTLKVSMQALLKALFEQGGSDLHICVGSPPQLRINGVLCPVRMEPLQSVEAETLCYSILKEEQRRLFEENKEIDFSFSLKGIARYRGNIFRQKSHISGVFRVIPNQVRPFETLHLPPAVSSFCNLSSGLVLVTGATGSGKSTTLSALIDKINTEQPLHIITIEDPIEFEHMHKKSLVTQRELGQDTTSFSRALKSSLRQDPDVVLIGEMRDLETISAALTIAETGHLVFATLHTNSAVSTITRIVDVFPAHQQAQVRNQLSNCLQGIICQQLLPSLEGGRILGIELLIPNYAIRTQIREDKLHQINQSMQLGTDKTGMQTLNQCLIQLIQNRKISVETAFEACHDPEDLKTLLSKGR